MVSSLINPPVLAKPFAENGDKTINIPVNATGTQAASLDEGFPEVTSTPINEGGIPPQREDFNGLGYLTTSQFFYLQMGGRFTFNSAVSNAIGGYPKGAVLQYTNPNTGESYEVTSLIPNNTYNFVSNPSYIDGVKWRKSFSEDLSNYVKTTGNQNIAGVKTFMNVPEFNGGVGTNEGGEIHLASVNNNSSFKNGTVDVFGYSNDETTHCIRLRMADVDGLRVYADGHATLPSSPASSDNSTKVATTAFVSNKIDSKLAPNVSSLVTITSSIGTSNGYTAPSNGFITAESTTGEATVKLIIGEYIVAQAYNYHGDSHGNQQTFLCCPIGRGQTVKYTRADSSVAPALAYFIPYA